MPSNLVKTPRDEKIWSRAKKLAGKYKGDSKWAVANHIFTNMKRSGGHGK